MKSKNSMRVLSLAAAFTGACVAAPGIAMALDGAEGAIQNRSIGYVMTSELKAIYDTPDGKTECPQGLNDGPREQFKAMFPEDGTKRKLVDTQLARESEVWFPKTTPEAVPYKYAVGNTAFGLNLDGKIGPKDFTSPEGEKGIDDQLQRAWACVANYRSSSYNLLAFNNWRKYQYNIIVIELTDVDSLVNDNDVTMTTYRGLDRLMTDATGATYLPGGTQRLDMRWGKAFIQKFHGKIVDGVLITDAADYLMPSAANGSSVTDIRYYNTQWRLNVLPERAEGLMGGYMDIADWNAASNQQRSTHHQAYGQAATPSIYRAMRSLADGHPDPKTGENEAISMALRVKFTQVFVKHPETAVSENTAPSSVKAQAAGDRD